MQVLLPPGWPRPKGYANGVSARGRMIFVAGMIGWDAQGVFHTDDLAGQVRQGGCVVAGAELRAREDVVRHNTSNENTTHETREPKSSHLARCGGRRRISRMRNALVCRIGFSWKQSNAGARLC